MTQPGFEGPQISIAVYRPKEGRLESLRTAVADHLPLLRVEGLATERAAIVMQAADGCILEVFEWTSGASIEAAHGNPRVMRLWDRFHEACDYIPLTELAEARELFAGFRPLCTD